MACLALALQPAHSPDLLLHTVPWFPPVRAMSASASFRRTRQLDSAERRDSAEAANERLGDDPLAAFSGQVVVGNDNKYTVVYRLVNSVYVLGITSADQDDTSINIFDCNHTVSQAVSVLVAACRGVAVTADKLTRRYNEVYLALSSVLHGVSTARLNSILASVQHDPSALLIPPTVTTADAESKARGAASWNSVKGGSIDRFANVELLSRVTFELPEETYAAGDEAMATFAPSPAQTTFEKPVEESGESGSLDPFAASDRLAGSTTDLAGGFVRKAGTPLDPAAQLAGLEVVAPKKAGSAPETQFIGAEGFEGQYGGIDWSQSGGLGGGLLGDDGDAWGGGLDAGAFGADVDDDAFGGGLGGLEGEIFGPGKQLEAALAGAIAEGPSMDSVTGAQVVADLKAAAAATESQRIAAMPSIAISEVIHANFQGLQMNKVGLQGTVVLRLPPGRRAASDAEFSFRLDGSSGIKRAIMKTQVVSSLGKGFFHVRAPAALEGDIPILKYRLQPRFTPIPLRIRFHTRRSEDSLSLMIQYVANPFLSSALTNVTFIMSLPFSPASLKLNPSAVLDRITKELRWHVPVIEPKAPPQRLRAQIPVIPEHLIYKGKEPTPEEKAADDARKAKELSEFKVRVEFRGTGFSLSGIVASPVGTTTSAFNLRENDFKTGKYVCSAS